MLGKARSSPNALWPERLGVGLLLAAFLALAHYYASLYYYNVVDDSLISLTYVKNFASGHGLVFNLGERVEGYTNFLWIVALAPFHVLARALGVDFVPIAVSVSIAVATADLLLVYVLGRRLFGHAVPALLATVLCAADNAYAVWSIQALEGHFFVLFVLLALFFTSTSSRLRGLWVGLCLAAVQMTRPDGALFAAAFGLAQLAAWPFGRKHAWVLSPRQFAQAVLAAAVVYGVYFAFRYQYYGYLLPNTFYLKVGTSELDAWSRGVAYVRGYFEERSYVPLLALPAVAFIAHPLVRALCLWVTLHLLYLCYVGGDFYPGHRFFVVLMPALSLLAAQTLWGLGELVARALRVRPRGLRVASSVVALAAIAATFVLGVQRGPLRSEILAWRDIAEAQFRFMRWLGKTARPGATIVGGDIGSAGYYAGLHVYDVFGVIDPVIAHRDVPMGKGKVGHEKVGTLEYFLPKRPDYIKNEYLAPDLYRYGYVLNTEMPLGPGVTGIWERDTLRERANLLPHTLIDFGAHDPGWQRTGDAFESWPSRRKGPGQQAIIGNAGPFVSSYHAQHGDGAQGKLTSPPFVLEGDVLELRVAGGHDPQRLHVALIVDGRRVHSATGFNTESFSRKLWDVAQYAGKSATLEITDAASSGWGHIMVDEVRQWQRKR